MTVVLANEELHSRILVATNTDGHNLCIGSEDPNDEDGSHVTTVCVIEVDAEWCTTQDWWRDNMDDDKDCPTHVVRTLDLSNTGWNIPLVVNGDDITIWHEDDLAGNAPGYQGCYEHEGGYDNEGQGIGKMINDVEALAWVAELPISAVKTGEYNSLWI